MKKKRNVVKMAAMFMGITMITSVTGCGVNESDELDTQTAEVVETSETAEVVETLEVSEVDEVDTESDSETEVEEQVIEADFEKYGLTDHFAELDKEYDCVTMCNDDNSYTTVGKLVFSNYQTFAYGIPEESGYFAINTDLPEEPGYEYKMLDITITYSDENAMQYGAHVGMCWENYYDIVGFDNSVQERDDGWNQFTVNWNGTDYTECMFIDFDEWLDYDDSTYSYNHMCIVRVPVGYDGFVIGMRNNQIEWGDDQYIYDLDNTDTIFFRFD